MIIPSKSSSENACLDIKFPTLIIYFIKLNGYAVIFLSCTKPRRANPALLFRQQPISPKRVMPQGGQGR